jgi:hypothetical protein
MKQFIMVLRERGAITQRESATLAVWKSRVQIPLAPPFFLPNILNSNRFGYNVGEAYFCNRRIANLRQGDIDA